MEEFIATLVEQLGTASEVFGVLLGYIGIGIIVFGSVKGIALFFEQFLKGKTLIHDIRIELGHHLALGLEFLVGKDVIESLIEPSWDALGKLAAIIAIRTVLTMYLARELKEVKHEMKAEGAHRRARA